MTKLISTEEKLKQIKAKLSDGTSFSGYDEGHWLYAEVIRLHKVLNKICGNYYCRFDNGPFDEPSIFEKHNVDCPTCIANKALTKKVKVQK